LFPFILPTSAKIFAPIFFLPLLLKFDSSWIMSSDLETYGEPFPAGSARRSYLTFPQFTLSRSPIYSTASTCTFDLAPNATRRYLTAAYLRWEFLTTLDFEWEVFTGRRPWKWSFVVYLAARLLALMSVILTFIGFNLTTHFNCNVG
jgi:hypothetical protein